VHRLIGVEYEGLGMINADGDLVRLGGLLAVRRIPTC
jgi:hypothetical protein